MNRNPAHASAERPCTFSAVVPAAGRGERMGQRKALLKLAGRPMLLHTLERLMAARGCTEVVIAVHPDDLECFTSEWADRLRKEFRVSAIVPGGEYRQQSVLAALEATRAEADLILIHDAARPLVQPQLIEQVAARAAQTGAAIAAVPSVATVKEVNADGRILSTPPRESLWLAQTPQGFRRELILRAHRRAQDEGFLGTDDALLVERMGVPVVIVEDSAENLKITTPADLVVAEVILKRQQDAGAARSR